MDTLPGSETEALFKLKRAFSFYFHSMPHIYITKTIKSIDSDLVLRSILF